MKKILIIVIILMLCAGCYDYTELNNIIIVSGIGIDYKNNNYIVTIETQTQKKDMGEAKYEWGLTKKVEAKTLAEAFQKLQLNTDKKLYYAHLKIAILSKEVLDNHFQSVIDYLLRDDEIRNIFYLVATDKSSPEEILNSENEFYPIISERIKNIIDNNKIPCEFEDVINDYVSDKKSIKIPIIELYEKIPSLENVYLYNGKSFNKLSEDMFENFITTINEKPNQIINEKINDENISLKLYNQKTKIKLDKNKINIEFKINAELVEDDNNFKYSNKDEYKKLVTKCKKDLKNSLEKYFKYLQENNYDPLKINFKYYQKYKKINNNYFSNAKLNIKINLVINKKGLINEVNHENNKK